MNDLTTPLTDAELDQLGDFLLDRIDDDADTEGLDEGLLCVPDLDGFLTAIVSGPAMIPPSKWLPAVWGDFQPSWASEADFSAIFTLMTRHMNTLSWVLMNDPESFEPIFHEHRVRGKMYLIVDEWCEGYLRGMVLAEEWRDGGEHIENLLAPIRAFTGASDWSGHELSEKEMVKLQQAITSNVREIHAWWLARREDYMPDLPLHSAHDSPLGSPFDSPFGAAPAAPSRRSEPKTGRNDPCPCGSGRKFKQCCLH